MRVEGIVLEDHGHVSIFGGRIVDDAAPNADGAPGDIFQTGDHAEGSCLAASRRTYKDHELAVLVLDLEIQEGELIVFVGPYGSGKTTALRMIAGLEDITRGTVSIGGRIVNDAAPKDRDVAMVFQNYALYPHLSVYDNMAFSLKMRKVNKAEIDRRVHEAARILGLDQLLGRKPKNLSGGQRQRVAMGRAIVREPLAFLMDEPLSNLDAKLRVETRAQIARIQDDLNVTTIYVTHDQVEAMTLGDRVAQGHGLNLIMRHVDRGYVQIILDAGDLRPGLNSELRVQVRERLVHKEGQRFPHNSPSHRHPLPLPAGEVLWLPAEQLIKAQDACGFVHPPLDLRLVDLPHLQ